MNRSIRFAKHPHGMPDAQCFEFTQEDLPSPGPDEVLIETWPWQLDARTSCLAVVLPGETR